MCLNLQICGRLELATSLVEIRRCTKYTYLLPPAKTDTLLHSPRVWKGSNTGQNQPGCGCRHLRVSGWYLSVLETTLFENGLSTHFKCSKQKTSCAMKVQNFEKFGVIIILLFQIVFTFFDQENICSCCSCWVSIYKINITQIVVY